MLGQAKVDCGMEAHFPQMTESLTTQDKTRFGGQLGAPCPTKTGQMWQLRPREVGQTAQGPAVPRLSAQESKAPTRSLFARPCPESQEASNP